MKPCRRPLRSGPLSSLALCLALAPALALTGCATTRLAVTTPEGARVDFSFPKNLVAQELEVVVGPHSLRARELRTDASAVIRTQAELVRGLAADAAQASTFSR